MLIIGAPPLVVYPAAGLIDSLPRQQIGALINKDATAQDFQADVVINGRIGEILGAVQRRSIKFQEKPGKTDMYTAAENRYDTMKYRRCGRGGVLLPAIPWASGGISVWKSPGRTAADSLQGL